MEQRLNPIRTRDKLVFVQISFPADWTNQVQASGSAPTKTDANEVRDVAALPNIRPGGLLLVCDCNAVILILTR